MRADFAANARHWYDKVWPRAKDIYATATAPDHAMAILKSQSP